MAKRKRRLFLHLGTHKTGSTSIQAALSNTHPRLVASGLEPYMGGVTPKAQSRVGRSFNSWPLAHAVLRPEVQTTKRLRLLSLSPLSEADVLAQFAAKIHVSDCPEHVVSAEAFCFLRQPQEQRRLMAVLSDLFEVVTPIVVLRETAGWRHSYSGQLDRAGLRPQLDALPPQQRPDGEWYYDQDAIQAFWTIFGTVAVINYDDVVGADGSVLPAFYRALGREEFCPAKLIWRNKTPGQDHP